MLTMSCNATVLFNYFVVVVVVVVVVVDGLHQGHKGHTGTLGDSGKRGEKASISVKSPLATSHVYHFLPACYMQGLRSVILDVTYHAGL